MEFFSSLHSEDKTSSELNTLQQGSLFHTIEYELSDIVNKITKIDNLDENEIKNIIVRQHTMILNYDLFLMSPDTRAQAQVLFTSKKFLKCFLEVIRLLNISQHEKTCINKLAYDYYIIPDNDPEVSNLLYQLTTEVNGKEVIALASILGMNEARILAMIRNSTFKEEKSVHRVNTYIIKCNFDLSVKDIITIYYHLFDRFTNLFTYSMMEAKPSNLSDIENKKFDNISIALLEMLNSLPEVDIKKVINDYAFTLKMVKTNTVVRFAIKSAIRFTRIISVVKQVEIAENINIP